MPRAAAALPELAVTPRNGRAHWFASTASTSARKARLCAARPRAKPGASHRGGGGGGGGGRTENGAGVSGAASSEEDQGARPRRRRGRAPRKAAICHGPRPRQTAG